MRAIEWPSPCTAAHLCLSQFSILEEYLVNLGLFMPYPEQRVRLENISSVQVNIILCEILKTNLCGKLRNNKYCISYVDGTPVVQKG